MDMDGHPGSDVMRNKEPKSSEKIRRGIRSEIITLQAERKKISKRGSLIDEQITRLNLALEGLDRKLPVIGTANSEPRPPAFQCLMSTSELGIQ
jgi:nucleotidyltransferase/DNA polymerase involved in DNA repair